MNSGLVVPSCCEMFLIIFIRRQSFIFRALFISIFNPFPGQKDTKRDYSKSEAVFPIITNQSNSVVYTDEPSIPKLETESKLNSVVQHHQRQRIEDLLVEKVSAVQGIWHKDSKPKHKYINKYICIYLHTWVVHSSCSQPDWCRWRWAQLRSPPRCAHTAFALARHRQNVTCDFRTLKVSIKVDVNSSYYFCLFKVDLIVPEVCSQCKQTCPWNGRRCWCDTGYAWPPDSCSHRLHNNKHKQRTVILLPEPCC